jgi:CSLREA domain-containing protein
MKALAANLAAFLCLAASSAADTFVVNNTADPGNGVCDALGCTLREAITSANANPGADTISFNIAGSGVRTISPGSPLPDITEAVTIDGYTQPGTSANTLEVGNDAVLLIELDGTLAGAANGLNLGTNANVIRGPVINRFDSVGISIGTILAVDGSDNVIEGNFIGTDAAGTADLGNNLAGVGIFIGSGNLIGGALPAARNLISGNDGSGVWVWGSVGFTSDNSVQGNYIGTDRDGTAALPNDGDGVFIFASTSDNKIGGTEPGTGNLISGNIDDGILISPGPTGNTIQGNFIGTDASGTADLENGGNGVDISASDNTIGGTTAGARNIISANSTGVRRTIRCRAIISAPT